MTARPRFLGAAGYEAERRGVRALAPAPGQTIVIDASDVRVEGTSVELPGTP